MSETVYDVHAVIVTYNSLHVIGDLLDSLPAAVGGLDCAVTVVDNGSQDGTADYVAGRDGCRLIRSVNTGYAGGVNRGVREGPEAEAILVLNPDVRLHKDAVPALFAAVNQPGTGIAVPQVLSPQGTLELSLRREPTLPRALGLTGTRIARLSEYVTGTEDYAFPRTVDWALGAVVMMTRKCYDAVGGWDESYFLYSEETDFCLRARDLGLLTRYEPRAVAVHIGGQSGRNAKTHSMLIVNRVRLYRRRHGLAASWCYFSLAIASELSWLLRGQRESWPAIVALLRPSLRPQELACRNQLIPR